MYLSNFYNTTSSAVGKLEHIPPDKRWGTPLTYCSLLHAFYTYGQCKWAIWPDLDIFGSWKECRTSGILSGTSAGIELGLAKFSDKVGSTRLLPMLLYAVVLQFHLIGTKSLKPVPECQGTCVQSMLQEDFMVCHGRCRGTPESWTQPHCKPLRWNVKLTVPQFSSWHLTSLPDFTNTLRAN